MTQWEIPQVDALSAVSITSTETLSTVVDHCRLVDTHAMVYVISDYVSDDSAAYVFYQGSLDGSNWYNLVSATFTSNAGPALLVTSSLIPARYTRVVTLAADGATSATATATVVSGASA
jgi:hypothetical protein